MKRNVSTGLLAVLTMFLLVTGCKPKDKTPVSELIAKAWTAQRVDHNTTTVYTKGGTSNTVQGYAQFSLNLSAAPSVTYKEFDGNTFSGQYELQGDNKLILKNLSPQPTGSNGTLEFTINSVTDSELKLTRLTASQKTGGTINTYTLSNP
ncbi:hypothetical protein [Tellurirhabdus bombi]|uniref:hypothetical protein n=1 Tax=Tellurirhabdus bombi TaxID=2907205 RepID=UPI00387F4AEE